MDSDKIKEFMERLTQLQRFKPLNSKEYNKLIDELALSHVELSKVDELSRRHSKKALKSEEEGEIDTALIELERAVILTPFNKSRRMELYAMYMSRYKSRGFLKRDINRAENQYKILLEQFPNDRSIHKLKDDLEKNRQIFKGKNSNIKFLPVVIGILLLVFGIAFSRRQVLFPRLLSRLFSRNTVVMPEEPVADTAVPEETAVALNGESIPEESYTLDIVSSQFKKRNGSFFYRFSGEITPKQDEVSELEFLFSWKNKNGDVEYTHTFKALEKGDAPIRPGDSLPLMDSFYFKSLPEDLTNATIDIAREVKSPPESYPAPQEFTLTWEAPVPEGIALKTGVRSWKYQEGFDREYYTMVWELTNEGYKGLKHLEAEIQWKDINGDIINNQSKSIIFPQGPDFSPGKRWRFQEVLSMPLGSNAENQPNLIIKKVD